MAPTPSAGPVFDVCFSSGLPEGYAKINEEAEPLELLLWRT